MSWLSQALHGGKNPADAAQPYLEQIPGTIKPYLDPYAQTGLEAKDRLTPEYEQLMSDPAAFINKLMEGYTPSEGYQARKDELTSMAGGTAAAGGFRGTETDIRNQSDIINRLMSQDMQDYLKNVLGAYQTGLSGEAGLMQQGLGAGESLASSLANVLGTQATTAFQGAQQQEANKNALLRAALGLGGSALGYSGFGGGGSFF